MQLTELRIAGFGGQGVILSAIILGKAASIHQSGYATMTQNLVTYTVVVETDNSAGKLLPYQTAHLQFGVETRKPSVP